MTGGKHVLIVVQNLPVPLDRRVWLECRTLVDHGYEVSVVCPKGPGDPAYEVLDDVHLYKYAPPPQARGALGYAVEFAYCWVRTARLSLTAWQRRRFDVLQACNPPDTYWLLAKLWRLRGVKFLFDHHDLNPELFLSRFGSPRGRRQRLEFKFLQWLENGTFRTADHVTSTNDSYRAVAIERGGLDKSEVTVVRSGPDTNAMRPLLPAPGSPTPEHVHTLVYVGIMGPQDGVDTVLHVMDQLVRQRGRTDVRAVLMGFGDCLGDLKDQCTALGLDPYVEFTGRVDRDAMAVHLSAGDVGLCPDLHSPLNDISTMNKTMEYMAYCLPSVSFDLKETRVSGGDSVIYVPSGDVSAFADAVEQLIDDPELRTDMGLRARRRVVNDLDWSVQAQAYAGVLDGLTGVKTLAAAPSPGVGTHDPQGRRFVALDDEAALRSFIRDRGRGDYSTLSSDHRR